MTAPFLSKYELLFVSASFLKFHKTTRRLLRGIGSSTQWFHIAKNPPKIEILKKSVKLTDNTHACSCLTKSEYEAHAMTKNLLKNREMTSRKLIFG
jgi:hypothetical protein